MRRPSVVNIRPSRTKSPSARPVNGNCPNAPAGFSCRLAPSALAGDGLPLIARVRIAPNVDRVADGPAGTAAAVADGAAVAPPDGVGAAVPASVRNGAVVRDPV
jgi:hypothetical protein